MPLDTLITAMVETSLNALIRQDAQSLQNLARLKGKILRIRLTDINKQLVFVFSQQIDVLAEFEGDLDCELALPISSAHKLKDKANLTSLIKQDLLHLEGDIDVIQQFSTLLSQLDVDIEQWLSHYTGDVFAHTLVRGVEKIAKSVKQTHKKQQAYISELLIEEWRIAPGALEMACFVDKVDDIQKQVVDLELRLNAFEKTNLPRLR